jgi:hypothetical protein
MQLQMQSLYGVWRDTVRSSGRITISFVKDNPTGRWVANLKERARSYTWRIGAHGDLFGKDYSLCGLNRTCGGFGAPRDTISIPAHIVVSSLLGTAAWHDSSYVDTMRQDVTAHSMTYIARRDGLLTWSLANCRDTSKTTRRIGIDRRYVYSGRDSTMLVDTCTIACPKFYTDAVTVRADTVVIIDSVFTDLPVMAYDTTIVPNCTAMYALPDSFAVHLAHGACRRLTWPQFAALKAQYGCSPGGDSRPIIDSTILRYYDLSDQLVRVDTVIPGAMTNPYASRALEFWCDTTAAPLRPLPGWGSNYDTLAWFDPYPQGTPIVIGKVVADDKYCWLPYSALVPDSVSCDEIARVTPARYRTAFGSCCAKDSTVYFRVPSVRNPGRWVIGSYTYRAPIYLNGQCDYERIDSMITGYVFSRLDTTRYISLVELETPEFTVTVDDSCRCYPSFDLINGIIEFCEPVQIRLECTDRPVYRDGRTIVIPCPESRIKINGEYGSEFYGLLTFRDYIDLVMLIRSYYDSVSNACPPCVADSMQAMRDSISVLRSRLDSLQQVYDAQKWICGSDILNDPAPGERDIAVSSPPAVVILTYSGGDPPSIPLTWVYLPGDGEIRIYGDVDREVSWCIRY